MAGEGSVRAEAVNPTAVQAVFQTGIWCRIPRREPRYMQAVVAEVVVPAEVA